LEGPGIRCVREGLERPGRPLWSPPARSIPHREPHHLRNSLKSPPNFCRLPSPRAVLMSRAEKQFPIPLGPGPRIHYLAHLERFGSIRTYSTIRRGEVLGYVSDSGNAKGTPTHLHYGVYTTGRRAINPYPLLTQR
jgi:hypothetical protein